MKTIALLSILATLAGCGGAAIGSDDAGPVPTIYPLRATCTTTFAGVRWEATDFGLIKVTLPDGTVCDSERSPLPPPAYYHPCPGCIVLECAGKGYGLEWQGGPEMSVIIMGKPLQVAPNILSFGAAVCEDTDGG